MNKIINKNNSETLSSLPKGLTISNSDNVNLWEFKKS